MTTPEERTKIFDEVGGHVLHQYGYGRMTKEIIYCPKCNSEDVELYTLPDESKNVQRTSMDEWRDEKMTFPTTTLELRYKRHVTYCRKCGYRVEKLAP